MPRVCAAHNSDGHEAAEQSARKRLLDFFADGQPHRPAELVRLDIPTDALDKAIAYLVDEEEIEIREGLLARKSRK